MLGQDFLGSGTTRGEWFWEKAESKQDHKEIKLQYSREMVKSIRALLPPEANTKL